LETGFHHNIWANFFQQDFPRRLSILIQRDDPGLEVSRSLPDL
jgi:hypothetical protein